MIVDINMHKVLVTFDRPYSLTLNLNDEQYAAAMDEYSWEDFYGLMEYEISEHLLAETNIDDIKDVNG